MVSHTNVKECNSEVANQSLDITLSLNGKADLHPRTGKEFSHIDLAKVHVEIKSDGIQDHMPLTTELSKVGAGLSNSKPETTWTWIIRMDFGLGALAKALTLLALGKRDMRDDVGEQIDEYETKRGKGNLPYQNKIVVKHPNSSGGLALLWKNSIKLEIINYTVNHVWAVVTEEDGFKWFLTCFYGWPEAQQKEKSWRLLEHLKTFVEGPWLVIGDFNAFLHASKKKSKRPPQFSQVDAFREALESCQLQDLGYKGYPFTWNNKRPAHASDHLPILLHVQSFVPQKRERGFKFEESWLLMEDCEAKWVVARITPDEEAIKQIQKRLNRINEEEMTADSKAEYLELNKKMDELLQKQEIYWAQRSRISWLKHGACDSMEECLATVPQMVTVEMKEALSGEFTIKEVKVALFQMGPTKALGPNGRLITDNVLVAYETLHTMHTRKKGKKETLALKLDISKAYDRVKWKFLQRIMERMGFPALWIERVMCCVTTPTFSILVNGKPYGMIHPSRGIRQGDPLSPYLFLLCAKGFSTLLAKNEGQAIMEILQKYAKASGQCINLEKSSVYFSSNTIGSQRQQILQILEVKEVERFESYLGLPTLILRAKYYTFFLFKGSSLEEAARMESMCAKSWWGQVGDERKIHWKRWDKLSTSKMEGGMGFRDLRNFNLAMLAKQGLRMIQGCDLLLYRYFKARYFPRSSFLDAKESPGCSYVWRSLMAALPILRLGYCWRVGNGSSISVVGDRWIPNHPTNTVIHPRQELVGELAFSELIDLELHAW
ncbi:uncharacterized protein LOC142633609 [Castanea sativa]|uniref:uncharacterized protein LOC142633609 n=1 Tax=Castanea sativa TaxID=21020 RepID=UPI003F64D351